MAYNSVTHAILIVLVAYLVYQQRRQDTRTDTLEREVGYVRGRQNGTH